MRKTVLSILALSAVSAMGDVVVSPSVTVGPVKPMHAVNNGPICPKKDQIRGNFDTYAAAKIPFARTHDAAFCASYGGEHTVDITAIFPNFDADENSPDAYDFAFTDYYLGNIRAAGTEVFFRLGQKIEHGIKKYGVLPPKDFGKWARICEHIIRHYNEGWANGFKWNIRYWEIWNEPDLDPEDWTTNPRCWGGSPEAFFDLFSTAAKHLKSCFPDLKIGGPALAYNEAWGERFLQTMRERNVPMDFFSWHDYAVDPKAIAAKADRIRALMEKTGYGKAESILNEWNYVKGWTGDWVYTLRVESGDLNQKGAAFTMATMCACQPKPVDMLMYYDARPTQMNGLFDGITMLPMKGYYPFYAWSKLAAHGTAVQATVSVDGKAADKQADIYTAAAVGKDGKLAILVCRYTEDNNVVASKPVKIRLEGGSLAGAIGHLTDLARTYTEVPVPVAEDGSATVTLDPNSFILIEK